MAIRFLVLVLFLVVLLAAITLVIGASGGRVSRSRLNRLAHRQSLVITPGNGNLVIRYLAITRRWRVAGLVIGVVVSAASSVREGRLTLNFLAAFAGWFVGAVIAEFRIATAEPGVRREASLEPRLLRDQLRWPARLWPLLMLALNAMLAVALGVAALAGYPVDGAEIVTGLVLAVAALGVPVLVGRHVLSRARPLGRSADLQDADDALRDRSLHVLAGCAVALLAYPAAILVATLIAALLPGSVGVAGVVGLVLLIGAPIAGWLVGRSPRPFPVRTAVVVPS